MGAQRRYHKSICAQRGKEAREEIGMIHSERKRSQHSRTSGETRTVFGAFAHSNPNQQQQSSHSTKSHSNGGWMAEAENTACSNTNTFARSVRNIDECSDNTMMEMSSTKLPAE